MFSFTYFSLLIDHMNTQRLSSFCFLIHLLPLAIKFLIVFQLAHNVWSGPSEMYETCGNIFSCGESITKIGYPFRGQYDPPYCGHPNFVLNCDPEQNITNIDIMGAKYRVLEIDQPTQTMKISREDIMEATCPSQMINSTLDYSIFDFATVYANVTFFYGCPDGQHFIIPDVHPISCGNNNNNNNIGGGTYVAGGAHGPGVCGNSVIVPAPVPGTNVFPNATELDRILRQGFQIRWKIGSQACIDCTVSKGRCGYDLETNRTACFCPDPPYVSDATCPIANVTTTAITPSPVKGTRHATTVRDIVLYVTGAVLAGVGIGWLVFYCRQRTKQQSLASQSAQISSKEIAKLSSSKNLSSTLSKNFTRSIPSYPSSPSNLGRGSSYFGAQVFNFVELEEATNNFDPSRELGEGAFGTVYYGVLSDGRIVAVKRLYENNFKRAEQFMNEVEILTRLRHQNLVILYGCTSRRSRELLLVYEYVPNGTVADHLHGKRAKSGLLSWPIRLNIAVETAVALAYLHKSDTIHRDVKTNNILLDNDFHVKVADFGLSRLFPNDVTHVSTCPQGTPGYVDPDYYQCYKLTEKSDVYSFGVVLIELISSLQAVDTNRHRHDINLSNMAMNKIQNHTLHELVDSSLGFETNSSVRRMVTLVAELAFRCLQQERDMRPSMEEVVEVLRGIENEDLNAHKVEIVDMLMDEDGGAMNGMICLTSPEADPSASGGSVPSHR